MASQQYNQQGFLSQIRPSGQQQHLQTRGWNPQGGVYQIPVPAESSGGVTSSSASAQPPPSSNMRRMLNMSAQQMLNQSRQASIRQPSAPLSRYSSSSAADFPIDGNNTPSKEIRQDLLHSRIMSGNDASSSSSPPFIMKTFSNTFRWLHVVLIILYSLTALIITSLLVSRFPSSTPSLTQLNQILTNWNAEMIEDILVVQLTATDQTNQISAACPSSYTHFNIFNSPTILSGCDCTMSTTAPQVISLNTCTTKQISQGCSSIPSVNSSTGFQFLASDGITVYSLCAKRIPGLSYGSIGSQVQCAKQCGSSDSTKICVSTTQACPLNYIAIGAAADPSAGTTTSHPIGTQFLFISSTSTAPSASSIVEQRITQGAGVCATDNTIQNTLASTPVYPLIDHSSEEFCATIDSRFTSIATTAASSMLSVNYLTARYVALPGFTQTAYSLYTRGFIPLTASRRQKDIANMYSIPTSLINVQQSCTAMLVTQAIYALFVGFISTGILALKIISKATLYNQFLLNIHGLVVQQEESVRKKNKCKEHSNLIFKAVITVIHFSAVLACFITTVTYSLRLSSLTTSGGGGVPLGDSYTVSVVDSLDQEMNNQVLWYVVVNFITFMAIIMIEVISLVVFCGHKLKEEVDVKLDKRYRAKDPNKRSQPPQQHDDLHQSSSGMEISEYHTHNIYAGNGINTTRLPQMALSYNSSKVFDQRQDHYPPRVALDVQINQTVESSGRKLKQQLQSSPPHNSHSNNNRVPAKQLQRMLKQHSQELQQYAASQPSFSQQGRREQQVQRQPLSMISSSVSDIQISGVRGEVNQQQLQPTPKGRLYPRPVEEVQAYSEQSFRYSNETEAGRGYASQQMERAANETLINMFGIVTTDNDTGRGGGGDTLREEGTSRFQDTEQSDVINLKGEGGTEHTHQRNYLTEQKSLAPPIVNKSSPISSNAMQRTNKNIMIIDENTQKKANPPARISPQKIDERSVVYALNKLIKQREEETQQTSQDD